MELALADGEDVLAGSASSNVEVVLDYTAGRLTAADRPSVCTPSRPPDLLPSRLRHASFSVACSHSISPSFVSGATSLKRVRQIQQQEIVGNAIATDIANERMFSTASQISASWDEFNLVPISTKKEQLTLSLQDEPTKCYSPDEEGEVVVRCTKRERATSLTEPVHILTNFLSSSCSPSPNRSEKQCYSPSMQQIVSRIGFSPCGSPTPSPTRRNYCHRSLSPIAAKPMTMSLKRKRDGSDLDRLDCSSPKRLLCSASSSSALTPDRSLTSSLLQHSLSVSSLDSESSNNSTASSDFPTLPLAFKPNFTADATTDIPVFVGPFLSNRPFPLSRNSDFSIPTPNSVPSSPIVESCASPILVAPIEQVTDTPDLQFESTSASGESC